MKKKARKEHKNGRSDMAGSQDTMPARRCVASAQVTSRDIPPTKPLDMRTGGSAPPTKPFYAVSR
jgi:hypothetical protein